MGKIVFTEQAWQDYLYWQSQDISRNGYAGMGKPEPLKHDLTGYWSRRIDEVNRLVYRITDDTIEVLQCRGHYKD